MTERELRRRFPNAAQSFYKINADDNATGVCAVHPEPVERLPLDDALQGEEACWYGTAERFEIVFTVYSVRPADWDAYSIKELQDFCVHAGILQGDGWKTLSGRVCTEKAKSVSEQKTVIEIRAI